MSRTSENYNSTRYNLELSALDMAKLIVALQSSITHSRKLLQAEPDASIMHYIQCTMQDSEDLLKRLKAAIGVRS